MDKTNSDFLDKLNMIISQRRAMASRCNIAFTVLAIGSVIASGAAAILAALGDMVPKAALAIIAAVPGAISIASKSLVLERRIWWHSEFADRTEAIAWRLQYAELPLAESTQKQVELTEAMNRLWDSNTRGPSLGGPEK